MVNAFVWYFALLYLFLLRESRRALPKLHLAMLQKMTGHSILTFHWKFLSKALILLDVSCSIVLNFVNDLI